MKNILQELEKVFYLIMKTNGDEITKKIIFNNDINTAFEALMQTVNKAYVQNINPNKQIKVYLKKLLKILLIVIRI